MRICAIVKYPPIEGGVSARSYWIAHSLAERGHQVHIVTNALEVEVEHRLWIPPGDVGMLEYNFANGGCVTVTSTMPNRARTLAHIPSGNPFATKLAGLATDCVRALKCQVVFSYYYEPYCMSGYMVSSWCGLPHVVQHAGSDRGRLMNYSELSTAYREMLRCADKVITPGDSLESLGVSGHRLARPPSTSMFLPRSLFTPEGPVLDVNAILDTASGHSFVTNRLRFDSRLPTFGVIGKVGQTKGLFDVIEALRELGKRGHEFNLLAMIGGFERNRFIEAILQSGLSERTWTIPMLPHWRVPDFIRACTAVCYLERKFPIPGHRPVVPQEILACGVCAVLSREIAEKQSYRENFRHGQNVLISEDPEDTAALAELLSTVTRNPEKAHEIGRLGASLLQYEEQSVLGAVYERHFDEVIERRKQRSGPRSDSFDASSWELNVTELVQRKLPASTYLSARSICEELDLGRIADDCRRRSLANAVFVALESLLERWQKSDREPKRFLDVLRFELNVLWSEVDLESEHGISQFPRRISTQIQDSLGAPLDTVKPVHSAWMRLGEFPTGIGKLVSSLRDGAQVSLDVLSDSQQDTYLFLKRGDLSGRWFILDTLTKDFLGLCDGDRTLAEVYERLREAHGLEFRIFREIVVRLVRIGVLEPGVLQGRSTFALK
jgi:glycosyltransferase involved in cell wall biosynthesis